MQRIIKISIVFLLFIVGNVNAQSEAKLFDALDDFYKLYLSNGRVDYQRLKKDKRALDAIYLLAQDVNISRENKPTTYKAYWINMYNFSVIKGIVENYPIASPLKVDGFFDAIEYEYGGKRYTLNDMESNMLLKPFGDPRFHFALVCGAVSCPQIPNFAFRPGKLEAQLDARTQKALNDPKFIRVTDTKNKISEIFKWFKDDFTKNGTVIDFINQYRNEKLDSNKKLGYYIYSWKLNEIAPPVEHETNDFDNPFPDEDVKSNIQEFTPSKLLSKGQLDLKMFNNLYSESKGTFNGEKYDKLHEEYFTTTFEVAYGITKSAWLNIGLIANIKSNQINRDSNNVTSFTRVFQFKNEANKSRAGLATIAPMIKISPFNINPDYGNFSIQSALFIPLFDKESKEGVFLDKKSYVWQNKFFYDKNIGDKYQIFAEIDATFNLGKKEDSYANNSMDLPVSVFFSYFPNNKMTIYGMAQHFELIDLGNGFSQNFTQTGLGMKFQLTQALNLELLYTKFLFGKNTGLGATYNVGLRYLL